MKNLFMRGLSRGYSGCSGFLLRVQVVQVAMELVEAVHRREELVAVA
jgi:hypothetical protein